MCFSQQLFQLIVHFSSFLNQTPFVFCFVYRSESSCGYLGPFKPDYDGNGIHLHRHVTQQRSAILSQTGLLLLHPVRFILTSLYSMSSIQNWMDYMIMFLLCLLNLLSFCAGVLVLLSVLIFHQSVLALLSSDHSVPLHHELSWSVACVGSAGGLLILGGLLFILLSLPFSPWQKCFPHKNSAT